MINRLLRLSVLCLTLVGLAACGGSSMGVTAFSSTTLDADAARLVPLSEQAQKIAQKESATVVLRQVDTDLFITIFRFVDSALTKEIVVVVPDPDAPVDKWYKKVNSVSPLLGEAGPAIDLRSLRAGPNRVAESILAQWSGCTLKSLTLYHDNVKPDSDALTWVAFCNTPQGLASGSMDNTTGLFQPVGVAAAPVPVTATPAPR